MRDLGFNRGGHKQGCAAHYLICIVSIERFLRTHEWKIFKIVSYSGLLDRQGESSIGSPRAGQGEARRRISECLCDWRWSVDPFLCWAAARSRGAAVCLMFVNVSRRREDFDLETDCSNPRPPLPASLPCWLLHFYIGTAVTEIWMHHERVMEPESWLRSIFWPDAVL